MARHWTPATVIVRSTWPSWVITPPSRQPRWSSGLTLSPLMSIVTCWNVASGLVWDSVPPGASSGCGVTRSWITVSVSTPASAPLRSSEGTWLSITTDTCDSALTLPARSTTDSAITRSPSRGRPMVLLRRIALDSAAASEPVSAVPSERQIDRLAVSAS